MSTVAQQLSEHSYSDKQIALVSLYLYILFIYIGGAAIISGIIILIVYKNSKHEKVKMIKK